MAETGAAADILLFVIPAKAGIADGEGGLAIVSDASFRWHDGICVGSRHPCFRHTRRRRVRREG